MRKMLMSPLLTISIIFLIGLELLGFFAIKSQIMENMSTTLTLRVDNAERIVRDFYDKVGAESDELTGKFATHDNIVVTYGDKILYKSDKSFAPNYVENDKVVEENSCYIMSRQLNNGWFVIAYYEKSEVTKTLRNFVLMGIGVIILYTILMSILLSTIIKKKISEPLKKVINANKEIANGNVGVNFVAKNSKGEVLDLVVSEREVVEFFQGQLEIIRGLAQGEVEQIKLSARSEQDEFSKYYKIIADKNSRHATLPAQFKKGIKLNVDVITELEDYTSDIMSAGASGLIITTPVNKDKKAYNSSVNEIYNVSFVDSISGIFSVTVEVAEVNGDKLTLRPIAKFENEQRRNYVRVPATGISAVMTAKIFDEEKKALIEITENVEVMDVSLGGIRIKTSKILKEDSVINLKLKAEIFGELDVIGEVRRASSINGAVFAGIEFFADNATNEVLYKFIRSRELEIFTRIKSDN